MARIIICLEVGGNLGHLIRDLPVALRLKSLGHDVAFVVRDIQNASEVLGTREFNFFQAPLYCGPMPDGIREPASYAEGLLFVGYSHPKFFSDLFLGWRSIFRRFSPAVVIADFAPTAVLVAHGLNLPVLLFGTGFEIPPPTEPLPWAILGRSPDLERLRKAERTILKTVNQVLCKANCKSMGRVAEFVEADAISLTTISELDHYSGRESGTYVGHVGQRDNWDDSARWREVAPSTIRILIYIREHSGFLPSLFDGLDGLCAEMIYIVPDATHGYIGQKRVFRGVEVHTLMPAADLVISHGGAGMTVQALLAGVPMLLLPERMEEKITTARVEALGAGIHLRALNSRALQASIGAILAECSSYREAAINVKKKYSDYSSTEAIERVAGQTTSLIA